MLQDQDNKVDYRSMFDPLIKDVEGYSDTPVDDGKGNPTIGHGINLNDEGNKALLSMHGYDPVKVTAGEQNLDPDTVNNIHDSIVRNKESEVRSKIGSDLFDAMKPHEQAAIMSLGYNSMNLLGPQMTEKLASGDRTAAAKEMILNSNQKNEPGVLRRRLKEAELYADPVGFAQTMKSLTPEERDQVTNIINALQNEQLKQEMVTKYGSYLTPARTPASNFTKINKLLDIPKVSSNPTEE